MNSLKFLHSSNHSSAVDCMQSRLESGSGSGFYRSQFLVLLVARENVLVLFVMKFFVIPNAKLGPVYVVGFVCMVLAASNLYISHEAWGGHCHALWFGVFLAHSFCFLCITRYIISVYDVCIYCG